LKKSFSNNKTTLSVPQNPFKNVGHFSPNSTIAMILQQASIRR